MDINNDLTPLTKGQLSIWFLDQLDSESTHYNISAAINIRPKLVKNALIDTFNFLIQRHQALRLQIVALEGKVYQTVSAKIIDIPFIDAQDLTDIEIKQQLREKSKQRISLQKELPIKVEAYQQQDRTILFCSIHHIISDFWSIALLLEELPVIYSAFYDNEVAKLPDIKLHFTEYCKNSLCWLKTENATQAKKYWNCKFQETLPKLIFDEQSQQKNQRVTDGLHYKFKLSHDKTQLLKNTARNYHVTFFSLLLACYFKWLNKISQQSDIAVGIPVLGRSKAVEKLSFGYFVNPTAIRCKNIAGRDLLDLCRQINHDVKQGIKYQRYPFSEVVSDYITINDLPDTRNVGSTPIFQTMFSYQKAQQNQQEWLAALTVEDESVFFKNNRLTINAFPIEPDIAQFEISMVSTVVANQLSIDIQYNKYVFNSDIIENYELLYHDILDAAIKDNKETKVKICKETLKQTYPDLTEKIRFHMEQNPLNIAIVSNAKELSYHDLGIHCNIWLDIFKSNHIEAGDVIAVMLPPGIELITATISTFFLGAYITLIDPKTPTERIKFYLNHADVKLLITDRKIINENIIIVSVSTFKHYASNINDASKLPHINKSGGALVFSSGSTGVPNCTVLTKNNLSYFTASAINGYHFNAKDRVLQFTSPGFDAFYEEVLPTLCCGATVIPKKPNMTTDLEEFEDFLNSNRITRVSLPTEFWKSWLKQMPNYPDRTLNYLKAVIVGGEEMTPGAVKNWFSFMNHNIKLYNSYGPSEASVICSIQHVDHSHKNTVPIGKLLPGTKGKILTENLTIAMEHEEGELFISGPGVSPGYLKNITASSKKFISFDDSNTTWFSTGDIVSKNSNGTLYFKRRKDFQIKINGVRIEPIEVESLLLTIEGVTRSAVILLNNKLIAFIEYGNETNKDVLTTQDYRNFLKNKLLKEMIPGEFISLVNMPCTNSGKIDRSQLKQLYEIQHKTKHVILTTDKHIKNELLSLISTWIGYTLSPDDNLFEQGMDSLIAVSIAANLSQHFNVHIPVKLLFEYPTINALSQALTKQRLQSMNQEHQTNNSYSENIPLTPPQLRILSLTSSLKENWEPVNKIVIDLYGALDTLKLKDCWIAELECHDILKQNHVDDKSFTQSFDSSLLHKFSYHENYSKPNIDDKDPEFNDIGDLSTHIIEMVKPYLDLTEPPFIKAALIKRKHNFYSFIIFSHQLICDMNSLERLIQGFQQRYNQYYQQALSDPECIDSYIDYANTVARLPNAHTYWENYLTDITPSPNLAFKVNKLKISLKSQTFTTIADRNLSKDIDRFLSENSLTPAAFFLAIYFMVLKRNCINNNRFAIGTAISHQGFTKDNLCIGPLTNFALIAPTDSINDYTFLKTIKAIQSDLVDAIDHQHIPFDEIIELIPGSKSGFSIECLFLYQKSTKVELKLNHLQCDIHSLNKPVLPALLCLEVTLNNSNYELSWSFDTGIYNHSNIQQISDSCIQLIKTGLKTPELPFLQLNLLPSSLNQQCIGPKVEWNEVCELLHTTFTVTARKYPFRTAIISEGKRISYGHLYRNSAQISRAIYRYKNRDSTLIVGILMNKGWEQVVSALGILRGGGIYTPLNPNLNEHQLHNLIKNSGLNLIITTSMYYKLYQWPDHLPVLTLDSPEIKKSSLIPLRKRTVGIKPDDPAYIMFTSGTTGNPKGVVISHKSALNTLFDLNQRLGITEQDVFFGLSNFSFDLSVYDVFGAFSNGAKLVLPDHDKYLEINHWISLLNKYQVSIWNSVPALYRLLVKQCLNSKDDNPQSIYLRTVLLSGDWIPIDTIKDSLSIFPDTQILSLGGATEASIWSIAFPVRELKPEWTSIPYGFPLSNQNCYVLDKNGEQCPPDMPGELFIGGVGVAQCYINNDEASRRSFIENHSLEKRLYKTGDAAKLSSAGYFEILGRLDNRVKIGGQFIELSTIETEIAAIDFVAQTAVIVHEEKNKKSFLIAFIVSSQADFKNEPEKNTFITELRNHLSLSLPRHMIPSRIVFLKDLPLTSNGKIDRESLKTYDTKYFTIRREGDKPASQLDHKLAAIWERVLELKDIRMDDNFFELGGDSLTLVSVATMINQTFHIDVTMQSFFLYQTLNELSPIIHSYLNEQKVIAADISGVLKGVTPKELNKEVYLDESIKPPLARQYISKLSGKILLTGCTGYLGSRLLMEILQTSQSEVYCLVRGDDVSSAKQRIIDKLKNMYSLTEAEEIRVIIVKGDLSKSLLGLTENEYQLLAHQIDKIIHCAAQVNFLLPRSSLKSSNVKGSIELIRLASYKKLKSFNYISTVSVFPTIAEDNTQKFYEDSSLDQPLAIVGGYPQSKWIAEKTMQEGRKRGLLINIFRPGVIFGDTRMGDLPSNVLLADFLKVCIDFGVAPDLDLLVDIAPVDYVAKTIIHASNSTTNCNYHLTNPKPVHLSEFINTLSTMNIPVKTVNAHLWLDQLKGLDETRVSSGIKTLISLLQHAGNIGNLVFGRNLQQFDCSNTLSTLKDTDIACPDINKEFLSIFINELLGDKQ